MVRIAHDDGGTCIEPGQSLHSVLQHRLSADKRQELLGVQLTRQRPQARPGAARKNDRNEHEFSLSLLALRGHDITAPDAVIREACAMHGGRIVEITTIENHRRRELRFQFIKVGAPELAPFGDDR